MIYNKTDSRDLLEHMIMESSGDFIISAVNAVADMALKIWNEFIAVADAMGIYATKLKKIIVDAINTAKREPSIVNLVFLVLTTALASMLAFVTLFKIETVLGAFTALGTALGSVGKWFVQVLGIGSDLVHRVMSVVINKTVSHFPFISSERKEDILTAMDISLKGKAKGTFISKAKSFIKKDWERSFTFGESSVSFGKEFIRGTLVSEQSELRENVDFELNNSFDMPVNVVSLIKVAISVVILAYVSSIVTKYIKIDELDNSYQQTKVEVANFKTKRVESILSLVDSIKSMFYKEIPPTYYGLFRGGVKVLIGQLTVRSLTTKERVATGAASIKLFGNKFTTSDNKEYSFLSKDATASVEANRDRERLALEALARKKQGI